MYIVGHGRRWARQRQQWLSVATNNHVEFVIGIVWACVCVCCEWVSVSVCVHIWFVINPCYAGMFAANTIEVHVHEKILIPTMTHQSTASIVIALSHSCSNSIVQTNRMSWVDSGKALVFVHYCRTTRCMFERVNLHHGVLCQPTTHTHTTNGRTAVNA